MSVKVWESVFSLNKNIFYHKAAVPGNEGKSDFSVLLNYDEKITKYWFRLT